MEYGGGIFGEVLGCAWFLLVRELYNLTGDSLMGEEDHQSYNHGGRKRGKGRKANREGFGFDKDNSNKTVSGHSTNATVKGKNSSKYHRASESQTTFIR